MVPVFKGLRPAAGQGPNSGERGQGRQREREEEEGEEEVGAEEVGAGGCCE